MVKKEPDPSFRPAGDVLGVGGGLFDKTDGGVQFSNAGLGIPQVTLVSRSDFIGGASVGVAVPGPSPKFLGVRANHGGNSSV